MSELPGKPQAARHRVGAGGGHRLRVLLYHRVAEPERTPTLDPALVSVTPDDFRRQMRHLARRYAVVSLDEVLAAFGGEGTLPRRAVLVTFDDAYRDFGETAWPILRSLGLTATLFVPTAYPGRPDRAFWWDRLHRLVRAHIDPSRTAGLSEQTGRRDPEVAELRRQMKVLPPEDATALVEELERRFPDPNPPEVEPPVLGWAELGELARDGVAVGAHTRWHPPLPRVPRERIREEMRSSLKDLREALGEVAPVIAYPYGFHDTGVVEAAREEGFELGFTCLDGMNRVGSTDPLRIFRTNVTRNTTPALFRLRMLPWFVTIDRWRHRSQDPTTRSVQVSRQSLREGLAANFSAGPPSSTGP